LAKVRGNTPNLPDGAIGSTDSVPNLPYPSIRSLPLLGVRYADYYRNAKIQETVYELLTQQYELAKVQEAKETPSVKVLDLAMMPEKRSFPPRTVIILFGASFALIVCATWILGAKLWEEVDSLDPRKILIQDVANNTKARFERLRSKGGPESSRR